MAPANTMDDLDSVASRNLLLFGSGTDHDFVLKCGERSFKVHRSIISPQSAVLRVLCNGNWKEGDNGEATLTEEDPTVVEHALRFLYTGIYDNRIPKTDAGAAGEDDETSDNGAIRDALTFNVQMYILADFLDIGNLLTLALTNCTSLLNRPNSIASTTEPISLALSNTVPSDTGLRLQILRSCANLSDQVETSADLLSVLRDAEPLAWCMQLQAKAEMDGLRAQLASAAKKEADLRTRVAKQRAELQVSEQRRQHAIRIINHLNARRNLPCG